MDNKRGELEVILSKHPLWYHYGCHTGSEILWSGLALHDSFPLRLYQEEKIFPIHGSIA